MARGEGPADTPDVEAFATKAFGNLKTDQDMLCMWRKSSHECAHRHLLVFFKSNIFHQTHEAAFRFHARTTFTTYGKLREHCMFMTSSRDIPRKGFNE